MNPTQSSLLLLLFFLALSNSFSCLLASHHASPMRLHPLTGTRQLVHLFVLFVLLHLHDGSDFIALSSLFQPLVQLGLDFFQIVGSILVVALDLLVLGHRSKLLLIILVHIIVVVLEHLHEGLAILLLLLIILLFFFIHFLGQRVLVLRKFRHRLIVLIL